MGTHPLLLLLFCLFPLLLPAHGAPGGCPRRALAPLPCAPCCAASPPGSVPSGREPPVGPGLTGWALWAPLPQTDTDRPAPSRQPGWAGPGLATPRRGGGQGVAAVVGQPCTDGPFLQLPGQWGLAWRSGSSSRCGTTSASRPVATGPSRSGTWSQVGPGPRGCTAACGSDRAFQRLATRAQGQSLSESCADLPGVGLIRAPAHNDPLCLASPLVPFSSSFW